MLQQLSQQQLALCCTYGSRSTTLHATSTNATKPNNPTQPLRVSLSKPVCFLQTMIQASLSEILIYLGIWVPWPLREPEILIRALGMDLLSTERCMLVTLQDLGDHLPVSLRV